jgi:hypothetical protein
MQVSQSQLLSKRIEQGGQSLQGSLGA